MSAGLDALPLLLGAALGGYLLGGVNSALIISAAGRLPDPRAFGSGNPGATNMLRGGGRAAAALTLLGDAGKGALAVAAAAWLGARYAVPAAWSPAPAALLGAVLGHVYSPYHRFRGGKGVATLGGALALAAPLLALGWALTWLAGAALYRRVAAGSAAAAAALPLYAWVGPASAGLAAALTLAGALVAWRHRDNLRRLRRGAEDGP